MTEDQLQASCILWMNNTYCLKFHEPRLMIFAVPNGGIRNKIEAMKLKATGLLAGVSDLIVLLPFGDSLYIELKIETGRQSPAQIEFQQRVEKLGHLYFICRSLDEFKEIINSVTPTK